MSTSFGRVTVRLALLAGIAGVSPAVGAAPNEAAESARGPPERPAASADGEYVDPSGRVRNQAEDQLAFTAGELREPHYFRAAVEMLALLGIGTAYFWIDPSVNTPDWDFPPIIERLNFKAVRFDNNFNRTNHLLHPLAGSAYYWFSRVNGLNVYESAAYAAASSTFFEYGLEWRELVSINDLIFTPAAGIAGGEFLHQLGNYLNSAPDGAWPSTMAAATLGVPDYVHRQIDGVRAPGGLPTDALGLSSAFTHRFRLYAGHAAVEDDAGDAGDVHDVGISAEIVAMPGYQRPGRFSLAFDEGNFVELDSRLSYARGRLQDAMLWVSSDLVGYYTQDYAGSHISGQAAAIAANASMHYTDRWLLGRRDHVATVRLPGPHARVWLASKGTVFELGAMLHPDFAAPRALAYPAWVEQHPTLETKSVLEKNQYYFAYGWSGRLAARLRHDALELTATGLYGAYRSIDGVDRRQQYMDVDPALTDQVLELGASLAISPPSFPVFVRVNAEHTERWSQMPGAAEHRWDRRIDAAVGLEL